MRFVLALCVVAGCTLSGSAMAGAARRRVRLLEALIQGIGRMRPHMIGMFEPGGRALEASGCPLLEAVGAQMERPGATSRSCCSPGSAPRWSGTLRPPANGWARRTGSTSPWGH